VWRTVRFVLRVATLPVGIVIGLWTAQVPYDCTTLSCPVDVSQFAAWQCALFGAGAAATLLALSLADSVARALRVLAVPVGVGVGLWTAQMISPFSGNCGGRPCFPSALSSARFAPWECALFGASAAATLLLLSIAAARIRPGRPLATGGLHPA